MLFSGAFLAPKCIFVFLQLENINHIQQEFYVQIWKRIQVTIGFQNTMQLSWWLMIQFKNLFFSFFFHRSIRFFFSFFFQFNLSLQETKISSKYPRRWTRVSRIPRIENFLFKTFKKLFLYDSRISRNHKTQEQQGMENVRTQKFNYFNLILLAYLNIYSPDFSTLLKPFTWNYALHIFLKRSVSKFNFRKLV